MFDNEFIHDYAFVSQFIASWASALGEHPTWNDRLFKDWLKSLGLTDDEVYKVYCFGTNGKLELEESAKEYVKKNYNKERMNG